MEKQFSIREALRHGIADAWKCKRTLLGLSGITFLIFIGLFSGAFAVAWLIKTLIGKYVGYAVVAMIAGIPHKAIAAPEAGALFIYAIAFLCALVIGASFADYFYKKTFLINAQDGQVTFHDVWASSWKSVLRIAEMVFLLAAPFMILAGIAFFLFLSDMPQLIYISGLFLTVLLSSAIFIVSAFRLRFASCFIIDRDMSVFDALRASYRVSHGNALRIFGYTFIYALISVLLRSLVRLVPIFSSSSLIIVNILLFAAYFVVLFIISFGMAASDVYVYRKLQEKPAE